MSKLKKIGLFTTGLILAMNLISTGGVAKSLGLYMSESTNSHSNYQQTFIINQTYGGPVLDYAYSVIATSDEGYALAGYTRSYGAGESDMWLVKTNAAGQVEWNQTVGGTAADYAFSVIVSSDAGYVLVGRTESYGAGNEDIWLIKIGFKDDITKTTSFPAFEVILVFILVLIVNSSQRKSRL